MDTTIERPGGTTFRGRPVTLLGRGVRVGEQAPDFTAVGPDMEAVGLSWAPDTVRVLCSVPSVDTPVCDRQTRFLGTEIAALPGAELLTLSVDLPFAQRRWCGASGLEGIVASDHRDLSFGLAYGVAVKELRLLSRALFVVDAGGTVRHAQYVDASDGPADHEAVLKAVRDCL
ncbi:thiol peroxidase [Nocardiopsis metallicus]|uniref:thiol peroxidase n=1 Tax=Nocardiopsis metallicus TaxID=179819 RepID=UPI00161F6055|nr:thiol peroxidase [Nocardiopsis metallicus]